MGAGVAVWVYGGGDVGSSPLLGLFGEQRPPSPLSHPPLQREEDAALLGPLLFFPPNGTIDLMYFPYYGKRVHVSGTGSTGTDWDGLRGDWEGLKGGSCCMQCIAMDWEHWEETGKVCNAVAMDWEDLGRT